MTYDLDICIRKAKVGNQAVNYRYDALGRRVARKEGSTKTALIWWGNSECAEHKHRAGQTVIQNDIMSHPTRLNAVIARAKQGNKNKLQWYHKNYLDHVYAVSNKRGKLIEHYRYSAFGEIEIFDRRGRRQGQSQIGNQITRNTRRLDTLTGYYLYKYRHYDPQLGRWPSRDPIEETGDVNLYTFAKNNSINNWDKLGLQAAPPANNTISIPWFGGRVFKFKSYNKKLDCHKPDCPCTFLGFIYWIESNVMINGKLQKIYSNIRVATPVKTNGNDPACVADIEYGFGAIKLKEQNGNVISVDGRLMNDVIYRGIELGRQEQNRLRRALTAQQFMDLFPWPNHITNVTYVPGTAEPNGLTIVGNYKGFTVDFWHPIRCGNKTDRWFIKHSEGDAP